MRLSQLARKLEKTPTELIQFLQEHGKGSYTSHNNKVSDEHVDFAIEQINPEFVTGNNQNSHETIPDPKNHENATISSDRFKEESNISDEPGKVTSERITPIKTSQPAEEPEVIRAPKIKLEGVKVVGKIDLPETKNSSKEQIKPPEEDKMVADVIQKVLKRETSKGKSGQRTVESDKKSYSRHHKKRSSRHEELTYEEKLIKEERRKEKQKELDARRKKQRKKQYYKNTIQSNLPQAKPKPKKKAKHTINHEDEPREIVVHNNPIRRFWGWLNGEYDNH